MVRAAREVAQVKATYASNDPAVVTAISKSIGDVHRLTSEGDHQLFVADDGSQRIYLWFPTRSAMALLVVRSQIPLGAAELLARNLIRYGDGGEIESAALTAAFATSPAATQSAATSTNAPTPGTPSVPTPTRTP